MPDLDLDALERRARDSLWHFVPNAVPSPAPPTGEEVLALAAEVRRLRAATLPPDLLRAALRVLAFSDPWHVAHALRYPESIGAPHDELYASGAEIQARAREALQRLEATNGGGN